MAYLGTEILQPKTSGKVEKHLKELRKKMDEKREEVCIGSPLRNGSIKDKGTVCILYNTNQEIM